MVGYNFPFKVLTLDAMGTIIRLKENPAKVYERFAREQFGIITDQTQLQEAFRSKEIFNHMEQSEPCYSFGRKGAEYWWRGVVSMIFQKYSDCSENKINQLATSLFNYYATPIPWMITEPNLIEAVNRFRKGNNVKIAIVSNFDFRLRPILHALDFPPIDAWFLSGEIGISKPDTRIFQQVADHFKVNNLTDILHIGDDFERDYRAATALGLQARLYAPDGDYRDSFAPEHAIIHIISQFLTNLS